MAEKRTELSELGEFGLIKHLTKDLPSYQGSTQKSIGDDAAVIEHEDYQTVVSTDLLMEHLHFNLSYMPLRHLGYKAVVVNVSDIYAMNAEPTQILVSLAISNRFSVEAMEELYEGIREACRVYNVDLIGGDTTSSKQGLAISVTAIGRAKPEQLAYRNGAKEGDILCMTGDVGAAYVGLQLLEREYQIYRENPAIQPNLEGKDYIVGRQLKPDARKDVFQQFQQYNLVPTSMIDISDGLSSELLHICRASQVGAFIEEENVGIHEETYHQALAFNIDPITCALHGGEDYELLFTIDPKDVDKIRYMLNVRIIGEITPQEDGVKLHTKGGNVHDIIAQGFTHH